MTVAPAESNVKILARGATRILTQTWTAFLADRGSGITVSSATVLSDPSGLTFGSVTVNGAGNQTTVTATVPESAQIGCHQIKWTSTLSNGEIEVRSVPITIVEHKNGG